MLIAATGGFGNPYRPTLPGLDAFTGDVLHAGDYREPRRFAGQHVVVVGAANSAVQIGVELAGHAHVTLVTRSPVRYIPQRPLGRDMHFWFAALGIDHLPIGHRLRTKPTAPVFDTGTYRAAIDAARPRRTRLFTDIDGTRVTWADGRTEQVDTILLAPATGPTSPTSPGPARSTTPAPRQSRGLSCTHPGLGYVGLEWQRSLASASLRGVGRDAAHVVDRLLARRTASPARCCDAVA